MPYFEVGRARTTVDSIGVNTVDGTPRSGGTTFLEASYERGFRYRAPDGDMVKEIALNVAEPYSWFVDLQKTKERALLSRSDFDSTLLRKDIGHTWYLEEVRASGLWNFRNRDRTTYTSYLNARPDISVGGLQSGSASLPASDLENQAAVQYGRMAPVVSEFSLSTFLGELREGLPRLIPDFITRAKTLKGVGSDYLNLEFGWKPLISDLQGLADSLLQASFGLYRPMGASHRTRKHRPVETFERQDFGTTLMSVSTGNWCQLPGFPLYANSVTQASSQATALGSLTRRTSVTRWFEGEFVYIPKAGFDPSSFLDRYETLANVQLTPSTLWELAPWSWLVDWSAQIGGSIAAMEAGMSNRILSTYYYAMEDSTASINTSLANIRVRTDATQREYVGPNSLEFRVERRRRRRIRGNPFGFSGSSSTTLNGSQMAILGALGLTKTR